MNSGWVDATLLRDFQAEGTDAHRLCTIDDGWVERFGCDVLISFKRVLARERLVQELQAWASRVSFEFGRVFARFIPRKNEEREPPTLIFGDPGEICRQSPPNDISSLGSTSVRAIPWVSL